MIQSLLEDRFQLKAHLEFREREVYELVVAKDGPKIKASEDQTPVGPTGTGDAAVALCPQPRIASAPRPPSPFAAGGAPFDPTKIRGFMGIESSDPTTTAVGTAVPIGTLMIVLRQDTGRPVIDKTNLTGLYDFRLEFIPQLFNRVGPAPTPSTASDPGALLATALEQQLGLKLESAKSPMEVLVVESAQRPSAN